MTSDITSLVADLKVATVDQNVGEFNILNLRLANVRGVELAEAKPKILFVADISDVAFFGRVRAAIYDQRCQLVSELVLFF